MGSNGNERIVKALKERTKGVWVRTGKVPFGFKEEFFPRIDRWVRCKTEKRSYVLQAEDGVMERIRKGS